MRRERSKQNIEARKLYREGKALLKNKPRLSDAEREELRLSVKDHPYIKGIISIVGTEEEKRKYYNEIFLKAYKKHIK